MTRRAYRFAIPIVAALSALAALHAFAPDYLLHQGFPLDDSWIHAVYAREVARSGTLAYNPGVAATGETSPLWALTLAAAHKIGRDTTSAVALTKALGFGLHVMSAVLVAAALGTVAGAGEPFVWAASALVAFHPDLVAASVSGMEVPLATLVVAAALLATVREKPALIAVLGAAAFAGRPETPVLIVAVPFLYWVGSRPRTALGLSMAAGAGAVAALGVISWRNRIVSGLLLPATFHAKVTSFSIDAEVIGFRDLLGHITLVDSDLLLAALAAVSAVLLWKATTAIGRAGAALMLSGLVFCAVSFALIHPVDTPAFYFQRYALPAVLPLVAALPLLAYEIAAALPSIPIARPLAFSATILMLGLLLVAAPARYRRLSNDAHNIDDVQVAFGRALAGASPSDTLWAVDAGAVRFFGAPFVVDLIGLNTPQILQADAQTFLDHHAPRYVDVFPGWSSIDSGPASTLPSSTFVTSSPYTVASLQPMRQHTLVSCDRLGTSGRLDRAWARVRLPLPTVTPPPTNRRDRVLVTAALACALVAMVQILDFGYGRDQGIFETAARAIREGGVPYRDAWDFKPPGIYFVYALAGTLFGTHIQAIRWLEAASLLSLVPAFALLSRRFLSDSRPGLLGAAFAVVTCAQMEFWHTGQPESFGAVLMAWAIVCASAAMDVEAASARRAQVLWAACGLCSGLATLLKPTIGIGGAALVAVALLTRPAPGARTGMGRALAVVVGPVLAGTLAPIAACVWFFASRGALRELADAVLVFAPRYTALAWQHRSLWGLTYLVLRNWLFNYSAINAAGLLLLIVPLPVGRARQGVVLIGAALVAMVAGVFVQARVFLYHFGSVLPLTALLAGWGFWRLWVKTRERWSGVVVFVALLVTLAVWRSATSGLPNGFLMRSLLRARAWTAPSDRQTLRDYLYSIEEYQAADNRRAAEWIRGATASDSSILVYGFTPELYVTAERRAASRYIYNVPQRTPWSSARARAELMADLERSTPQVILVERRDFMLGVTGLMVDSVFDMHEFTALRTLVESKYTRIGNFGRLDVYRRHD